MPAVLHRYANLVWLPLVALLCLILAPQLILWPNLSLRDFIQHGIAPALLLLLALLMVSRFPHRSIWLWMPAALLAPQELFYQLSYGKATDAHAMAIIAETDIAEATGYLTGLGWLILAALLLVLICISLTSAWFKARQVQFSRGVRITIGVLTLAWVGWLWHGEIHYAAHYAKPQVQTQTATASDTEALTEQLAKRPLPNTHNLYHQSYPLNLILAFNEFYQQKQALAAIVNDLKRYRFGAYADTTVTWRQASSANQVIVTDSHNSETATHGSETTASFASAGKDAARTAVSAAAPSAAPSAREIYVLMIGETLRPDRLQLNGYSRPTTPRLSGRGDVVSWQNMISPWAWTRMSVPVMLSRKSAQDHRYFPTEPSLVQAFTEAGFKTYWLSTQSPLGVHDSSIALHASEADEVQYLNPIGYKKEGFYDDVLVTAMARVLKKNEPKQLIVLHTLGSHFNYNDRYPANFDLFKPSFKAPAHQGPALNMHNRGHKEALNNAYDNSVAFTDAVVFTMIEQLEATGARASFMLVSDHGENLFDGDCDKSGHGHSTDYDYRVGALWWGSSVLKQQSPAIYPQFKSLTSSPLMTSQVFETMLDLAAIKLPDSAKVPGRAHSLLDQQAPMPQRLLATGVDFDRAERQGVCRVIPSPSP